MPTQRRKSNYRPTRVFAALEDPQSHQTSVRMVAVEYQEEIPLFFTDPYGTSVNVFGIWEHGDEHYPCPRESTDDTVLVMTNRGIHLYCYGCSNFFTEGGRWGFKTSFAAFEQGNK